MEIPRHIRTAQPACSSTPQIHRNLSVSACPHIPTRGANRGSTAQWEGDRAGLRRVDRRGRVRAVHGAVEPPGGRRVRGPPACAPGAHWLDVGCGSGALASTVARRCRPRTLLGVGRSAGFVAAARAQGSSPALFARADAQALPVGDAAVDVAVSGLVLNFLPEPGAAVAEAARVVTPGGLVAAYVWDYAEGMGFLRHFWDAVTAVDPSSAAELDEGRRFPLCRPAPLRRLWSEAALVEVEVAPIEVPTRFTDFADLWDPLLAGQGPAPG
ncbi:class I SAM-dependent methyltransferase [Streptomyces sp. NR30]|uniref:Class I SAM-dependent methyltransferase n=2 Tax=Streptomyces guryensis TaxID=2886947 RepID=A0A9Q3VNQ6_9ACTN|nr:class I SAM-dependent methyltransferase [Streptomyces guryensis]